MKISTLKRVRNVRRAYEQSGEAIIRLKSEVSRVTPTYSLTGGKGPPRDKMAEYVSRLEALEAARRERFLEYETILAEVDAFIADLPEAEAQIIRKRYVETFHGWDRLCKEMHYSRTAVFEKHRNAIKRCEDWTF